MNLYIFNMNDTPPNQPILAPFDFSFKILIFGHSGVGKATLIFRYIGGGFVDRPRTTSGVNFWSKKIRLKDNRKIKMQIWDFENNERLGFLMPTYVKGADATIFLYDITNLESLHCIPEWIEIVKRNAGDIPLFLFGTKSDLDELRTVPKEDVYDLAKRFNISGIIEVSAKTGESVEESLLMVSNILVDGSKNTLKKFDKKCL
jgi:Ras-related protein Rab-5C